MKFITEYFKAKSEQSKKRREDSVEEYILREGDGIFLMDARDWFAVFDTFYSVVADRSSLTKMRTREVWGPVMQGCVPRTTESAQNFYKVNFSYKLEVADETEIVLELSQEDGRTYEGLAYPYSEVTIPLALYAIRSATGELPSAYSKKDVAAVYPAEKCVSISLSFKASKGTYFIVPCTEEQPDRKPYPAYCLEVIYSRNAAKLPSAFREADPTPTKLDPSVLSLHRKLI